jgi:SAM-dependent methyltransferase
VFLSFDGWLMPTSNLALWPDILSVINQVPHRRVLDVGPGRGKAAVLLREYLDEAPKVIDAVEKWAPYVDQFQLARLYDRVWVGDVTGDVWTRGRSNFRAADLLPGYDLVLMGDVIEHIELEPAFELLARIPGRVVICTPVEWFDNDPTGIHPVTEQHVSHWTEHTWRRLAQIRPIEVRYKRLGGWIVRTAPL